MAQDYWVYVSEPGGLEIPVGGEYEGVWERRTRYAPGERREDYLYTADGYLGEVRFADTSWDPGPDPTYGGGWSEPVESPPPVTGSFLADYDRDALGRVIRHRQTGYYALAGNSERSNIVYDNAGRVLSETSYAFRAESAGGGSCNSAIPGTLYQIASAPEIPASIHIIDPRPAASCGTWTPHMSGATKKSGLIAERRSRMERLAP